MAENPAKNRERQKRFRDAQRLIGREAVTLWLTWDEKHYLQRTLDALRAHPGSQPGTVRKTNGQMVAIDI